MSLWSRRGKQGENPDDVPTVKIGADDLTRILADPGTDPAPAASKVIVEPSVEAVELADPDRALTERRALIQLCLYAMDRARSGGVVERLEHGLAEVGVRALRPDGERFDPAHHEAGGAVPTDDTTLDGIVAETEVVGFADRDVVLRAPVVTVYTSR